MQKYNIVTDREELDRFIEWLPELKEGEEYLFQLLSRKKYLEVKRPGAHEYLASFTCRKSKIHQTIYSLELPLGMHTIKGSPVEEGSIALYMMPNPRNILYCTKKAVLEAVDKDCKLNIQSQITSHAMKPEGRSRKLFVDFDFDRELTEEELSFIDTLEGAKILKTRGGYHVVVQPSLISFEGWYKKLSSFGVDVRGDMLLPVPGTIQGGFTPRFL